VICLLNNNIVSTILDNSPKKQNFLKLALKQYWPNTPLEKLKGLCKTRWVERHYCLKTFGELYEHDVTSLDAMVNPHVYPEVNEHHWNWLCDQNYGSWIEK